MAEAGGRWLPCVCLCIEMHYTHIHSFDIVASPLIKSGGRKTNIIIGGRGRIIFVCVFFFVFVCRRRLHRTIRVRFLVFRRIVKGVQFI